MYPPSHSLRRIPRLTRFDAFPASLGSKMTSVFTPDDVAQHASASDCWIIIDGLVYDVTSFLSSHPGGKKILVSGCGCGGEEAGECVAYVMVVCHAR